MHCSNLLVLDLRFEILELVLLDAIKDLQYIQNRKIYCNACVGFLSTKIYFGKQSGQPLVVALLGSLASVDVESILHNFFLFTLSSSIFYHIVH